MPPRIRTAKPTKALKENIGISAKTKLKSGSKVTKPPRKVLGDKTNSASDDNASIEIPLKTPKKPSTNAKITTFLQNNDNIARPRRDRRIPSRFVENQVLKNLSNNKENAIITTICKNDKIVTKNNAAPIITNKDTKSSISKNDSTTVSPFKTPQKVDEISLVANRPRRISRLPSRFEDHSISPSKFIPVQPCHASTPLAQKKTKEHETNKIISIKLPLNKNTNKSADTNNNAEGRALRTRKGANADDKPAVLKNPSKGNPVNIESSKKEINRVNKRRNTAKQTTSPVKQDRRPVKKLTSRTKNSPMKPSSPVRHSYLSIENMNSSFKVQTIKSPVKPSDPTKKPSVRGNESFKLSEENKDVYEFTFDQDEEPAPKKKKRKAVKRKPAKTKPNYLIFKNNYDQNVNKALAVLKNAVTKNSTQLNNINTQKPNVEDSQNITKAQQPLSNGKSNITEVRIAPQVQRNVAANIIIGNKQTHTNNINNIPQIQENILLNVNRVQPNVFTNAVPANPVSTMPETNKSIRVEDIATDFESPPHHDIDYSPVNSPNRPETPVTQMSGMYHNDDPLNLKENISFDPNPIASSSMNTSFRHPNASPWRVEFERLPIRWHVNSYMKPNMTPAVECSFVNLDDKNKKKQSNEVLPEIVQQDQPNLIQTSIISFIKEVVERSSSKKNRGRSATPANTSLFNDVTPNEDNDKVKKTTRQLFTPKKNTSNKSTSDTSNAMDSLKDISNCKENSKNSSRGCKRKNNEEHNEVPAKTPLKQKDERYFGFDDDESLENVSPPKDLGRKRSLRQARARAVLREINEQMGPTRATIPIAVKTARRAEVEKLYDEMKSASDEPEIPTKKVINAAAEHVIEPIEELNEDSQTSVHLFEDIDSVHHWKLTNNRKSYGKAKKVTFVRKASSDTQDSDLRPECNGSDEEEDLDPTFDPGMPLIEEERKRTKKKSRKRQKMTKKEEEEEVEAEAWAANFNSMCEDVEEFTLLVE